MSSHLQKLHIDIHLIDLAKPVDLQQHLLQSQLHTNSINLKYHTHKSEKFKSKLRLSWGNF